MVEIDKESLFWKYISSGQKGLIECGIYLADDLEKHPSTIITDFSYIVFPFAKAYEGFLKQFFLGAGFITEDQYQSTHFRIGKALNPHLEKFLRHESVYDLIVNSEGGRELADKLWDIWKKGRNLVFHYFPHNLRSLSHKEALTIISDLVSVMEETVEVYHNRLSVNG